MRPRSSGQRQRQLDDGPDGEFSERLVAAAGNEPEAIRDLVDEFGPALTNFARRQGMSDPEGMANTAMFSALANLDSFRGRDRGTFRSYLYRILRRRVVDEIRYTSVRPRTVAESGWELGEGLVDPATSTFDDQIVDEDYVDGLLTQLTIEQRQILELRVLNDLSIQETADRTGRSVPAVKAMQRRALLSLRVAAAATALVLALVIGWRMLLGAGQQTLIVDNSPAEQPVDDRRLPERSLLPEVGELPGRSDVGDSADDGARAVLPATDDAGPMAIEGASSVEVAAPPTPESVEETTTTGAPTTEAEPQPGAIVAKPDPVAPCTVVTDGTPAVDEIAMVAYTFSGPFALFDGTAAHIIGRDQKTAHLTGFGGANNVRDGKTFPVAITPNMFTEDGDFAPRTTLVGGEIKTACTVADDPPPTPCTVTTDANPTVGQEATVTYTMSGIYDRLDERWSYVAGRSGTSAFTNGRSHQILEGSSFPFTIDGSMLRDGAFEVRSYFRSGEGYLTCHTG